MADNARGVHVSPGVYSREIDLTYAVKSLGITTLGLAGETQKGPAFQPMAISNWREFVSTFGGTNPEKFKGSQYPKYELPYIAKSYLTQSNQLEVVRALGLSGYNAGPAWLVTADMVGDANKDVDGDQKKMVVAVLRSRGDYLKYRKFDPSTGTCACPTDEYDTLVYRVGEVTKTKSECGNPVQYNKFALELDNYAPLYSTGNDCEGYEFGKETQSFSISASNLGRFKIKGITGVHNLGTGYKDLENGGSSGCCFEYAVSLNPYDKDYIIKVLGTDPSDGDAPIYVEALYDVALSQAIAEQADKETHASGITRELSFYQVYSPADYCGLEPVASLLTIPEGNLSRRNVGQRYLADEHAATSGEFKTDVAITFHPYDYATNEPITSAYTADTSDIDSKNYDENGFMIGNVKAGHIYTVSQYTDGNGRRHYYYRAYTEASIKKYVDDYKKKHSGGTINTVTLYDTLKYIGNSKFKKDGADFSGSTTSGGGEVEGVTMEFMSGMTSGNSKTYTAANVGQTLVKNLSDGLYYRMSDRNESGVTFVTCDLNNYKSAYRYASTPWIVSNLMGDYEHIEMKKLFRFHTISDGKCANHEVKISIENIRPDDGVFDVVVRDINDTDEYQVPLEKYARCNLVPGTNNYIAYKIGSYDGMYESKSKYITVECKEGDVIESAIPAGFLGYPSTQYGGYPVVDDAQTGVTSPWIRYNTLYDIDVKNRKQYFGLSTRVGVDLDMFEFKGNASYIDSPQMLSHGFHLDSRLDIDTKENPNYKPSITVDGEFGYKFDAVSRNNRTTTLTDAPIIGTEEAMTGTIYEYDNLRKFTVYFYGGFDGWDEFRTSRTNTDDFKASKYLGTYDNNSGEGYSFNRIDDPESLGLNQNGITSDWYAYLAAIRQFANPEAVDINVFATPGIDYVNNKTLVEEAIEMIEEERADSIYVVTTPDKPMGAGDFVDEMYTPDDAVYNLEDSELDSNYTCTYYPWVKYLDQDNNQYIYLPPTKDVVRNFAQTDNTTYPWFAPAGLERGDVNCVRAHFITKLADEDTLYEGRINPVKTFATDGVKIWGQKNLQVKESQLNRIAVRRLLLRMRKLIAIACRSLIFEPNDSVTKNTFLSTVTPIMDNIRANRGISDYKIEVNDTVESRERRELPAKIYFKPYNALEYVVLDFILTPEGVSFDNI